ncbi:hypothetical protein EYB53_010720 [Candidatus Chloroploca sp. M-50]|uniref:Uncharacterized protein n=1 Tax=Candidatus Chloroploca mongolica TaxID=2528176 RepID=A0ABS4D9Q2_9CHLR|nr:hypothetical protein [Candidatus Chloroploca mongolica]MBP1466178.1 hypothetical protein [Candidatus Chloroploca mongolica]
MTVFSSSGSSVRGRTGAVQDGLSPHPAPYLRVPERLLRTYAHDPLAVGVYLVVARCALAHQAPVPLSAADLAALSGDLHVRDAKVMRRIRHLVAAGWLVAHAAPAVKPRLWPVWAPQVPWCLDSAQQGKPGRVQTCRVPLELFDTYLGRLEPHAGRRPAIIVRYFTHPLLDLADLGRFVLCHAGYALPNYRLFELALMEGTSALPAVPLTLTELLHRAVAGTLRVTTACGIVKIEPSRAGWRKLGYEGDPRAAANGSPNGSCNGSALNPQQIAEPITQRIARSPSEETVLSASGCDKVPQEEPNGAYAWDSWDMNQRMNPPPHASGGMGGGEVAQTTGSRAPLLASAGTGGGQAMDGDDLPRGGDVRLGELDPALRDGHATLNAARPIHPGEWFELLHLQQTYGAERMLVWQARAARAARDPARGIVPAYYQVCAADEGAAEAEFRLIAPGLTHAHLGDQLAPGECHPDACAFAREPTEHAHDQYATGDVARDQASPSRQHEAATAPLPPPTYPPPCRAPGLDPACEALLQAMGVRARYKLVGVPLALIHAWHEALLHPGIAARFADPVAFAVSQMMQQIPPPPLHERERWAAWEASSGGVRSIPLIAPQDAEPSDGEAAAWIAHARRLVPTASSDDLATLVSFLLQGATDTEAQTWLAEQRANEGQRARQEVV